MPCGTIDIIIGTLTNFMRVYSRLKETYTKLSLNKLSYFLCTSDLKDHGKSHEDTTQVGEKTASKNKPLGQRKPKGNVQFSDRKFRFYHTGLITFHKS